MHYISFLTPEYLLPSQWIPVLAPTNLLPVRSEYLFTLHQSVPYNLSDISRSTIEINLAQLRSVRNVAFEELSSQPKAFPSVGN